MFEIAVAIIAFFAGMALATLAVIGLLWFSANLDDMEREERSLFYDYPREGR